MGWPLGVCGEFRGLSPVPLVPTEPSTGPEGHTIRSPVTCTEGLQEASSRDTDPNNGSCAFLRALWGAPGTCGRQPVRVPLLLSLSLLPFHSLKANGKDPGRGLTQQKQTKKYQLLSADVTCDSWRRAAGSTRCRPWGAAPPLRSVQKVPAPGSLGVAGACSPPLLEAARLRLDCWDPTICHF